MLAVPAGQIDVPAAFIESSLPLLRFSHMNFEVPAMAETDASL